VIKKRSGRRPALPIAKVYNQTTRGGQTTRGDFDKYTDTKPSVIKKKLAEGQLYQLQKFTVRQQGKARPQEELQRSRHRPITRSDRQGDPNFLSTGLGFKASWV
jgi:hypothetical protein